MRRFPSRIPRIGGFGLAMSGWGRRDYGSAGVGPVSGEGRRGGVGMGEEVESANGDSGDGGVGGART